MLDMKESHEALNDLIHQFYAVFDNRMKTIYVEDMNELCIDQVRFIKKSNDIESFDKVGFMQPRVALLNGGELIDFHEYEVFEHTIIHQDIACRHSKYVKKGLYHGAPYEGSGTKMFHFVRTAKGWRISSMIWQDDEA